MDKAQIKTVAALTIFLVFGFSAGTLLGINIAPKIPQATITQTIQAPSVVQTIPGPTSTTTSTTSSPTKYTFSGSGIRTTEIFTIPTKDWKVYVTGSKQDTTNKYFVVQVYIYTSNNEILGDLVNLTHEGDDYTISHGGPGQFYLKIAGMNAEWTVTVTAPP